jgi:GDP-L-fucose synthase
VAGHRGMVGSAIVRRLKISTGKDQHHHPDPPRAGPAEPAGVMDFMQDEKPDQVYLAAAKVGGIHANNTYPAEFIHENLVIQTNVIHAAHISGVKKLLFLGSSCIYPREAAQPMKEEMLMTGPLEPTNEPYAIAKIAGIKLCESYNRQYGIGLPQRHAHQPLRPWRQLSPGKQSRDPGPAAPVPQSRPTAGPGGSDLGLRQSHEGIFARG